MAKEKATSTAVSTVVQGTAVVPWEQELAALAQAEAKDEKLGGNFFSTKGGKLEFMGSDLGSSMDVVILEDLHDRAYYPGSYGDAKSPVCFSFSKDGQGMVPHDESMEKQHESCDACDFNKFGSANVGKGKACREYRRLAVISADNLQADEVQDAILGIFKVPPTSRDTYSNYKRTIAMVGGRPLWSIITTITLVPDPAKQFVVKFKQGPGLAQEVVMAIRERLESVKELIAVPYPKIEVVAAPAKPAAKTPTKFGVGAKK